MQIPDYLQKAIKENDVTMIKAILLRQINADRNLDEFQLKLFSDYAEENLKKIGIDLFVEDDGESKFVESKDFWDKELWQELRIEFEYNFSRKKMELICILMKHLRDTGHPDFQIKKKQEGKSSQEDPKNPRKQKMSESLLDEKLHTKKGNHSTGSGRIKHKDSVWIIGGGILGGILGGVTGSLVTNNSKLIISSAVAGAVIGAGIIKFITKE
jgi:hypothetical protein